MVLVGLGISGDFPAGVLGIELILELLEAEPELDAELDGNACKHEVQVDAREKHSPIDPKTRPNETFDISTVRKRPILQHLLATTDSRQI